MSWARLVRAPRRHLGAVALAFAALGFVWLLGHAAMVQAVGGQFKEPIATACDDHYPAGWNESTRVEWSWSGTPPQLRCDLFNPATGEAVTWSSGSATLPGFLLAKGAIVAASLLALAVIVSLVAGIVGRSRRHSSRAGAAPR